MVDTEHLGYVVSFLKHLASGMPKVALLGPCGCIR